MENAGNSEDSIRALATRTFDAIENGDVETLSESYADDIVVWHSPSQTESNKTENIKLLSQWMERTTNRRYTERRLHVFPDGFVQEHHLCCTGPDGREWDIPACCVCTVRDGKITRANEYIEGSQVRALVQSFMGPE